VAVFSIDLQTVRFFDKNLNPLSELSLNPAFGSSITCVCLSSDNNLWIFDETGPGLKKIDPVTGRVLQTIDCSNTLKEGELSISDMKEYKNRLYMLDGDHNVYEFNFMGNLLRTFRLPGSRHLQFHGDYLISASSGHLLTYNLDDGLSGEKLFDDAKAKSQIYFGENYIYEVSKNIVILPAGQGFYKNIF
jgi:hypothetical protein